ncbi:MAG: hypothetical protein JO311_07350 [Candidatus Eremiobacteraeota bacterium]|nr:hypothetical protein [Candidatus Eremiobacteraeota bacterium]MBV9262750.1 hypothetical protein [Candidatus Eremiobacteraeota bacterium]
MPNRIRALAAAAALALAGTVAASAYVPSVADLDAAARAVGNRRDIAQRIGESVFRTQWAAQVSQISANQLGHHLIVGIRVWGVKFHRPLSRDQFVNEVVALIARAFAAAPQAEEADLWASVPIGVAKGVVVSGDLAKPTSRTVFSVTAQRPENASSLRNRIASGGSGVFWDAGWAGGAFQASR